MDVMRDMLKADGLIDEETGDDPFADVLKPRGGQSRWPLRDFSGHAGFPKFNGLKSARVILIRS